MRSWAMPRPIPRPAPVTRQRREVAIMTTPSLQRDLGLDLGRDVGRDVGRATARGLLFRLSDQGGIVRIPCDRQ